MKETATLPAVYEASLETRFLDVLLVGQAPGSSGEYLPLGGRIGKRLAEWAGVPTIDPYFDRVNVLASFPGKTIDGKGDLFPRREAEEGALALIETLRGYDRVVFCGLAVAHAFGRALARDPHPVVQRGAVRFLAPDPFVWKRLPYSTTLAVAIPHPSGVVPFWNDPANVARAERLFRNLVRAISAPPPGDDDHDGV